jgi:predicted nucleic acid-binding Zn ribbon protein
MSFTHLSSLIEALRPSFRSPEQQQLDAIINAWAIALGSQIADNSRPLHYERHNLTIAVRQAIWAQQLTAQTHQILQHLRPHLPLHLTIKTLRFRVAPDRCRPTPQNRLPSTPTDNPAHPSRWPRSPAQSNTSTPTVHPNPHISPPNDIPTLPINPAAPPPVPSPKLQHIIDRWRSNLDQHAPHLQHCPHCQCLTPPAELDRWQMCALCATTLFQSSMPLGGQRPIFQDEPPQTKTRTLTK